MTSAKVALKVLTSRPRPPSVTMVRGRSKTASKGTPPNAVKWRTSMRTRVSVCSLGTSETATKRENFRREAKKWTRLQRPSTKRTSTCPKSCCENSPGSPSKRTTGLLGAGRNRATRS